MPGTDKIKDDARLNARRMRDRRIAAQKRKRFEQLVLQAHLALESHTKDKAKTQRILGRMLANVLSLMSENKLNDERRADLVEHFETCSYGGTPIVELAEDENNMVHISGMFDIRDLSKRIMWSSTSESHLKESSAHSTAEWAPQQSKQQTGD